MLQIIGTVAGIDTENVVPTVGDPFTSTTIRLMSSDGRTSYVRVGRDFVGDLPEPGESVTLGVWVRPYVNKQTDSLGYGLTAFMRIPAAVAVPA